MKHLSTFLALLSALTVNVAVAQEVSIDEAQGRAVDFLKSQTDGAKRVKGADVAPHVSLAYTSKSEDKTCFYVFNAGEDEGFVIVGGDEAAHEILGYCDHGSFDYDTAPANLKWWLSQYTEQIAHAAKAGVKGARRVKAEATTRENIEPLIKTEWDQDAPYNGLIPKYTKDNNEYTFITGCVATAMAQVMKYHHFTPFAGATIPSYNSQITYPNSSKDEKMEIPSITVPSNYSWDDMLDSYSSPYDPQNANAVAELMYHAGASVLMKYGTMQTGGSSASSAKIPGALSSYFGYDKSAHNEYRGCYSDEVWEDMVYAELSNGKPVLYSGSTIEGAGHQFICDGYDGIGFHINWGWSGNYNGFFLLTPSNNTPALTPDGTGNGGGAAGSSYDQGQLITLGLKQNAGGSETPHLVQITDNSTLTTPMYMKVGNEQVNNYTYNVSTDNSQCYLSTTIYNISCLSNKFDYGVKAVNKESDEVKYLLSQYTTQNLAIGNYYSSLVNLLFAPSNLTDGTYQLFPAFRVYGSSDWMDVQLNCSATIPEITITRDVQPSTQLIQLTRSPEFNNGNNPYSKDLVLKLYFRVNDPDAGNDQTSTTFYFGIKNINDDYLIQSSFLVEDIPFNNNITGKINFSALANIFEYDKKYTLTFFSDANYTETLGDNSSIDFTYREGLTVNYGVSPAGYGTLILPFNAEVPEGMTLYSCDLTDNNNAILLSPLTTTVIERNKPYIVKANYDDPSPYSFTGPKAIDDDHLFVDGFLCGAVAGDVELTLNDYILQYNSVTQIAGFYLYNDENENRKAAPYRAFLRIQNRNLAPPVLPNDEPESIEEIRMNHSIPAGIYSLDGKRQSELQKGLNVIILEDGTSKKVYVK